MFRTPTCSFRPTDLRLILVLLICLAAPELHARCEKQYFPNPNINLGMRTTTVFMLNTKSSTVSSLDRSENSCPPSLLHVFEE